jgi:hypothetical protein
LCGAADALLAESPITNTAEANAATARATQRVGKQTCGMWAPELRHRRTPRLHRSSRRQTALSSYR